MIRHYGEDPYEYDGPSSAREAGGAGQFLTEIDEALLTRKGGTVRVAREHLREDITEAEENIKQLKHGIKRDKAALKEKKSANPAVPPRELKARGVTLAKDVPGLLARSFTVNPGKLRKGSEEQRFAEVMVVSGVTSLPKLATLLHKGYDLSKSQADETAVELFNTLKNEGALT